MFKLGRLVDLTISSVMMRLGGFHPNMAVVSVPSIQHPSSNVRTNTNFAIFDGDTESPRKVYTEIPGSLDLRKEIQRSIPVVPSGPFWDFRYLPCEGLEVWEAGED